jgi:hypothetical protein
MGKELSLIDRNIPGLAKALLAAVSADVRWSESQRHAGRNDAASR